MSVLPVICFLSLILSFLLLPSHSSFTVPFFFSSNMVLQRDAPGALIWGWETTGSVIHVTATINDISTLYTAPVDYSNGGYWSVRLAPQPVSFSPSTISILNPQTDQALSFLNILFGDVVLCSGQSNMEMSVNSVFNAKEEIAQSANYTNIRIFAVEKNISFSPLQDVASRFPNGTQWAVASPSLIGGDLGDGFSYFSATCWFFAKHIYDMMEEEEKVPLGLIESCWGGTIIEAWSSPKALAQCEGEKGEGNTLIVSDADGLSVQADGQNPNQPSVLWNAMIVPFIPLPFSYVIWYQGEANVLTPKGYECTFPSMIIDWSTQFQNDKMGFFFVQLASTPMEDTGDSSIYGYAELRDAQLSALNIPNLPIGFATAIDLGDHGSALGDIHPRNKTEVGRRLALSVLGEFYGLLDESAYKTPSIDIYTPTVITAPGTWTDTVSITFPTFSPYNLTLVPTESCTYCCSIPPLLLYVTSQQHPTVSIPLNATSLTFNGEGGEAYITYDIASSVPSKYFPLVMSAVLYAWIDFANCIIMGDNTLPMPPGVWLSNSTMREEGKGRGGERIKERQIKGM